MKTDAKTMAEIYRHMANNLDNNLFIYDGVEILINGGCKWGIIDNDIYKLDFKNSLYRIKPKTITVNGVEIPKPLSLEELKDKNIYFFPSLTLNLFDSSYRYWLTENQVKFIYKTKEEAIETSKKLFGIE